MKKLISLALTLLLSLGCMSVAFAAVGDISVTETGDAIEWIYEENFTGTVGESVSANSDWSISGNQAHVTDTYAADPTGANNTVLCVERTGKDSGREKMRLDVSAFNNGNYVTEDMTITFRYFHEDGNLRLVPRLRQEWSEGEEYGKITLKESNIQNKWCDIRLEFDVHEGTDGMSCTVTGWVTADGASETQFYTGSTKAFKKDNAGNWGIWQIDFETAYTSSGTTTNLLGKEYVDDFKIYVNRGDALTVNSVTFANESGEAADEPQEKGTVTGLTVTRKAALPATAKLLVAVYDEDVLSGCTFVDVADGNTSYDISAAQLKTGAESVVKVFCFNMNNLVPLTDAPFVK